MNHTILSCRPFFGPVAAQGEENPRAHGCVCYIVEREDGARRRVNVNGLHVEVGPWVGSWQERLDAEQHVRRLEQRIRKSSRDQGTYVLFGEVEDRFIYISVHSVNDAPLPSQDQYHSECADWIRLMIELQQELTEAYARLDALEV